MDEQGNRLHSALMGPTAGESSERVQEWVSSQARSPSAAQASSQVANPPAEQTSSEEVASFPAERTPPPVEGPSAPEQAPSLSKEEVVARMFDAFNRGDLLSVLTLAHPEIVFQPVTATVTQAGEPYRGHDGIRRYTEDVERYWAQIAIRPTQIRAAGRAVVALGLVSGRGQAGSFENAPTTWVVKFRDGLVSHVQVFSDERYVKDALVGRRGPLNVGRRRRP
jgi:ketosteroid isomerase-like protein